MEKKIKCDICLKLFDRKFTLNRHRRKIHSEVQQFYQCKECTKAFPRQDNLWRHERSHRAEGLIHCRICSRGFRSDYVAKHEVTCGRRAGDGPRHAKIVLKVRAVPSRDYFGGDQQNSPRHKLIYQDERFLSQTDFSAGIDEGAIVSPQGQGFERKICSHMREVIKKDDICRFEEHFQRLQAYATTIAGPDAIFQKHDPRPAASAMLTDACLYGANKIAQHLIESGSNLNQKDAQGDTPLHWACRMGAPDIVKLLVNGGADVELSNINMRTPLVVATENCQSTCMQALLLGGASPKGRSASVNVQNDRGWTALHFASIRGKNAMIELLLRWGADVDMSWHGRTALCVAAVAGELSSVKLLRDHGARIDGLPGAGNFTPLEYVLQASGSRMEQKVEYLIQLGANVNLGISRPLERAIQDSSAGVVELLLDAGAKLTGESAHMLEQLRAQAETRASSSCWPRYPALGKKLQLMQNKTLWYEELDRPPQLLGILHL